MPTPTPRPATVPTGGNVTAYLTKEQRAARKKLTRPTRLSPQLINDFTAAIRSGAPVDFASSFVNINRSLFFDWMNRARAAASKEWDQLSQLERLCLSLRREYLKAEAEAGLRTHRIIAQAAGVIGDGLQTRTVTTRQLRDRHGNPILTQGGEPVEEVTTVVRTLAPEWRAAMALGSYRFPEQLAAVTPAEPDPPAENLSVPALMDRIEQIRRERSERGLDAVTVTDSAEALG